MSSQFVTPQYNRRFVSKIIILNIIIFVIWNFATPVGVSSEFMISHFLVSWNHLVDGHYWVLLTSAFSHNMLFHLFMNMFVLRSFGSVVEAALGSERFLKFYLTASVISSLCHALVSTYLMGQPELPALGASGAVSAVILLFSVLFPRERILILGLIPIPAIWGVVLMAGLDIWGLVAQTEGGGLPIGHGAHLGGTLTGILYYFFFLKPRRYDI